MPFSDDFKRGLMARFDEDIRVHSLERAIARYRREIVDIEEFKRGWRAKCSWVREPAALKAERVLATRTTKGRYWAKDYDAAKQARARARKVPKAAEHPFPGADDLDPEGGSSLPRPWWLK